MGDLNQTGIYIGIDLCRDHVVLSYYSKNMTEPGTFSTVMGEDNYCLPLSLAKRFGVGQWFFGAEAKKKASLHEAELVENLWDKAMGKNKVLVDQQMYPGDELLFIYLNRLLLMAQQMYTNATIAKVVVALPEVNMEAVELLTSVMGRLGIPSKRLMVVDHRETFYYYVLKQDPRVFLHDVMLYDFSGRKIRHCLMKRNTRTTPQLIQLQEGVRELKGEKLDTEFDQLLQKDFEGENISAVYLTGDGFDGEWMKQSLGRLCHGRRVFLGKNLYSKGACYAGYIKDGNEKWPYTYIGDNELKLNVSLKVLSSNNMEFVNLISAGESWYEEKGECEVILDGTPEFECWIQRPESRRATVEVLELNDLPKRENRMTRLRITATPLSDKEVRLTIRDLGFGELSKSTGRIWEHTIGIV
ncbi:MAG: hypothetical protein K5819_00440 [Lachnospiraceae bacterium]|nr:hypothetical protein [Lachnospiraceae bacterium]